MNCDGEYDRYFGGLLSGIEQSNGPLQLDFAFALGALWDRDLIIMAFWHSKPIFLIFYFSCLMYCVHDR